MITHRDRRARSVAVVLACLLSVSVWSTADAQERMPPIPAEKMTDAQKKAAAEFVAARGTLSGPWAVLLRSPDVVNRARGLSDYLRFNSSLPPRLSEFVILITARQWSQNYEWNAHYPLAMKGGLKADVAKAIAEGRRPDHMEKDEEVAYDFCTELALHRSVSDATYARAVSALGENGVVDMVGLHGYYTLISMVLNTARTPLPAGSTPALSSLPR